MAEADAFGAHHPVDYRAARAARAETVPEIFLRADHQARRVVFVEGAEADEVRAVPFEFHAARFGQTFERDFPLQPLDLALRDARHSDLLSAKTCQVKTAPKNSFGTDA